MSDTIYEGKPRNPDLYLRIRRPRVYYRYVRKKVSAFLRELWCGALALWLYGSTEIAEISSAVWLVLWGLVMLLPGNAFDASHGYDKMRVVPEVSWALASLFIGLAQTLAVLWGCVCKRRIMAQVALSFYLLLAGMFVCGRWPVCIALYGWHAFVASWVLKRLAGRRCK